MAQRSRIRIALLLATARAAAAVADPVGAALQRALVWHGDAAPGAYVVARATFTPPPSLSAPRLAVFADSRYVAFVNGVRAGAGGPERFDWRAPTYDTIDLAPLLTPGAPNTLVLLAHNYDTCGGAQAPQNMPEVCAVADPSSWWLDTPSGRFMNHVPGVAAAVVDGDSGAVVFETGAGAAWRTSNATRYGISRAVWASVPDNIDGRVDGGDAAWTRPGFDDSAWPAAVAVDGAQWGPLRPRGVPRLRLAPAPLALLGGAVALPVTLNDTHPSAVFDAGSQVLAFFAASLSAVSAPGLVLSLTWFERRDAATGALTHSYTTSTYVTAGAAAERFETADVFGGRYIRVSLSGGAPPFSAVLTSLNATDARYPFELVASFDAPGEPFFARLFSLAAATISINSADSFTDCSTRERAEWLGDAVINEHNATRLAFATVEDDGSTTYADTRLLRGVLKRAALSSRSFYPTAFQIRAHTASDRLDFNGVWSDYGMAAITAVARLLATTGDAEFVASTWPDWRASLFWVMSRVQQGSGLGLFRETVFFTDPLFLDITCGVTMNAFAFAALSDGAAVASALGFDADAATFGAAATALRAALVARAFNESAGAFNAAVLADTAAFPDLFWAGPPNATALAPNALANYVALAKGVLDGDAPRAARVVQWLMAGGGISSAAGAPMTAIQLLSALFSQGASSLADKAALDVIRANWALMVSADDVGTLWEFFDDSGEVSHNMGAAPLPFLLECVLGVTTTLPLSPTQRRVSVEPHLGDLAAARGVAVTEFGPVGVSWQLVGGAWGPPAPLRAVSLELNASIAQVLPVPARSPGLRGAAPAAAAVVVTVALPLSDAATPPPADESALLPYCLALSGAPRQNVTEGLASGALTLDSDRRYLRFEWPVALGEGEGGGAASVGGSEEPRWLGGPPLRGLAATASLAALLSAPAGGC